MPAVAVRVLAVAVLAMAAYKAPACFITSIVGLTSGAENTVRENSSVCRRFFFFTFVLRICSHSILTIIRLNLSDSVNCCLFRRVARYFW
jgi:hypothetical protein